MEGQLAHVAGQEPHASGGAVVGQGVVNGLLGLHAFFDGFLAVFIEGDAPQAVVSRGIVVPAGVGDDGVTLSGSVV